MSLYNPELNEYEKALLKKMQALVPSDPPPPWGNRQYIFAAGIFAGGWTNEEHLLLLSMDGYSVNNPLTGEMLLSELPMEDVFEAILDNELRFKIPATNEVVDIFGIRAGGGVLATDDGWYLDIIYPWYPRHTLTIQYADPEAAPEVNARHNLHAIKLDLVDGSWVRCGFSPSGKHFAVIGEAGAEIYTRSE